MLPGDDPRLRADPADAWPVLLVLLVLVLAVLLVGGALALF